MSWERSRDLRVSSWSAQPQVKLLHMFLKRSVGEKATRGLEVEGEQPIPPTPYQMPSFHRYCLSSTWVPGTALSFRDIVIKGPDTALELPVQQGKQTPMTTIGCDE